MSEPNNPEALQPWHPELDNLDVLVSEYLVLIAELNQDLYNWAIFISRAEIGLDDKLNRLSDVYQDELVSRMNMLYERMDGTVKLGPISRALVWLAEKFDR